MYFTAENHLWVSREGVLHEYDVGTGKVIGRFTPDERVLQFEFASDGPHMLLTNRKGFCEYWHVTGQKQLAQLTHVFNICGYYEGVTGARLNQRSDGAVSWADNTTTCGV